MLATITVMQIFLMLKNLAKIYFIILRQEKAEVIFQN